MIKKVFKYILKNGLTILALPLKLIPKVSIQLWYNVGSKDEKSGQKGIAHLIEHMIFKGTTNLSECDINLITHKLSGYCNAFTSYDYTGYLFDFPSQHWHEALPIMADCMTNCTFKQDFLNSELKAVIQELKMYRDDYNTSLFENLITTIFYDHPYHHPIIGYKQDLWNLNRNDLIEFYKEHYLPNNATLVVVGDIEYDDVFEKSEKYFAKIKPNFEYKKNSYYHSFDLKGYQVKLYRDVKQPIVIIAFVVPGASKAKNYLISIISKILGSGKGSRLYKKLVNKYELVTDIDIFIDDLFEYGLFNIYLKPKLIEDISKIIDIIRNEIEFIISNGLSEDEILRAIKKTEIDYFSLLESNRKQAYEIGKYFLATGDEQYFSNYTKYPKDNLPKEINQFCKDFLLMDIASIGYILPIKDEYRQYWVKLQELSDFEDNRVLSNIKRDIDIEEGKCVYNIEVKAPIPFIYPKSKTGYISNGLKILSYNNANLPKINLILDFKSKYYYDPKDLQGLGLFTSLMLEEGTKNYNADQFADILESYGIDLDVNSGHISMNLLSVDFVKSLELLNDILTQAIFDDQSINKIRQQLLAELNDYWDQPIKFVTQLAKQEIYKDHPYSNNSLGTFESIKKINKYNLLHYYQNNLTPKETKFAIVGDIQRYDIKDCVEHMLNIWKGSILKDISWPEIMPVKNKTIDYNIIRDQTVLCYAGLSVDRKSDDYDKLLIFDQIFTGGILGSMSSKLFDLRERSGLFYTIGGSMLYNVGIEPGLILIKTLVSNDRLKDAENSIEKLIDSVVDSIDESEVIEAKNAIINSLVDNFADNYRIANSFIFLDNYGFNQDYFDNRADEIANISIDEIKSVVKKYLSNDKLIKLRVGRVS